MHSFLPACQELGGRYRLNAYRLKMPFRRFVVPDTSTGAGWRPYYYWSGPCRSRRTPGFFRSAGPRTGQCHEYCAGFIRASVWDPVIRGRGNRHYVHIYDYLS